jgi:hypothetical protein
MVKLQPGNGVCHGQAAMLAVHWQGRKAACQTATGTLAASLCVHTSLGACAANSKFRFGAPHRSCVEFSRSRAAVRGTVGGHCLKLRTAPATLLRWERQEIRRRADPSATVTLARALQATSRFTVSVRVPSVLSSWKQRTLASKNLAASDGLGSPQLEGPMCLGVVTLHQ